MSLESQASIQQILKVNFLPEKTKGHHPWGTQMQYCFCVSDWSQAVVVSSSELLIKEVVLRADGLVVTGVCSSVGLGHFLQLVDQSL